MLIYFGYSYCPDVCPTTLAMIGEALAKLGAKQDRIVPIFITVDPQRDTPAQLKTYLKAFGAALRRADPATPRRSRKWRATTASISRCSPCPAAGYGMDHSNVIYLMGPDGRFVTYWDDTAIAPDKLAEELRARL